MRLMKPKGEVGMSKNTNNKKENVVRKSNHATPADHRGNGKMKYLPLNLERLTVSKQRDFIRIRQLVIDLPELRLGRISRLSKAIDEGTYHVSSKKLAEAIIQKNFHYRLQ